MSHIKEKMNYEQSKNNIFAIFPPKRYKNYKGEYDFVLLQCIATNLLEDYLKTADFKRNNLEFFRFFQYICSEYDLPYDHSTLPTWFEARDANYTFFNDFDETCSDDCDSDSN